MEYAIIYSSDSDKNKTHSLATDLALSFSYGWVYHITFGTFMKNESQT